MIKLRHAGYCNLKLFLLYLVIYGHWIETSIHRSLAILIQYRLIYLIHMPLFAFLSGLFLRNQTDCLKQIKRMLPIYIILQLVFSIFSGEDVEIWTPWWTLWYLLSYCLWAALGWLWFRFAKGKGKLVILITSILVGALAGFIPWLDRTFSGSRTVVFFPYFWAGLIINSNLNWQKLRPWGVASLIVGSIGVMLFGNHIPVTFLYHASPFGTVENGFVLRFLCYGLSSLLGFFLLTAIPAKRLPFTKAGADTLPAYLIHGPIVTVLREIKTHWILCAVFSALLLYIIYKMLQWRSPLYGIIQGKGGTELVRFSENLPATRKIGIQISSVPDRRYGDG